MKVPYIEKICKLCPFKGTISEPNNLEGFGSIRYIDCQRDNEDVKDHFLHTLKDKNDLWLRQTGTFDHCIYSYEDLSIYIN